MGNWPPHKIGNRISRDREGQADVCTDFTRSACGRIPVYSRLSRRSVAGQSAHNRVIRKSHASRGGISGLSGVTQREPAKSDAPRTSHVSAAPQEASESRHRTHRFGQRMLQFAISPCLRAAQGRIRASEWATGKATGNAGPTSPSPFKHACRRQGHAGIVAVASHSLSRQYPTCGEPLWGMQLPAPEHSLFPVHGSAQVPPAPDRRVKHSLRNRSLRR